MKIELDTSELPLQLEKQFADYMSSKYPDQFMKIFKYKYKKCDIIDNPKDEIALNHYAIMSEEYFRKVKMTRGAADRTDNVRDMEYYNKNDTEASEIIDTELKNLVELQ